MRRAFAYTSKRCTKQAYSVRAAAPKVHEVIAPVYGNPFVSGSGMPQHQVLVKYSRGLCTATDKGKAAEEEAENEEAVDQELVVWDFEDESTGELTDDAVLMLTAEGVEMQVDGDTRIQWGWSELKVTGVKVIIPLTQWR